MEPFPFQPSLRRGGRQGFTLLEVLIAMLVLSIGILGYLAIQAQSIGGRTFSKRMSEAILTTEATTEEMLTTDFTQVNGSGTLYRRAGACEADEQDYLDGKAAEVQWSVTDWSSLTANPNTEIGRLKTFRLLASWLEREETRSTQMATWARGGKIGDSPD